MIERSKAHFPPIRISIFLVMLGMCVFIWGFGYKLSLYNTHKPTIHRIPEAKLLSKNEDPNATDSLRLCVASAISTQMSLFFCAALVLMAHIAFDRSSFRRIIRTADVPGPQLRFILSALFFRPPPIPSLL